MKKSGARDRLIEQIEERRGNAHHGTGDQSANEAPGEPAQAKFAMPAVRRQMPQGMSTEASMTARWYSMSIIIVCSVIPAKLRMIPQ